MRKSLLEIIISFIAFIIGIPILLAGLYWGTQIFCSLTVVLVTGHWEWN